MCLSPICPDLELSGRRAAHSEMTPRKLDGFHEEFAEGVGFFGGGVELRLVVDVEHLHIILSQLEPPPWKMTVASFMSTAPADCRSVFRAECEERICRCRPSMPMR